jgi:[acyl-carrier-protein] S-malonyltransferase
MKKIIIFPGQGSQLIGMGKQVYNQYDIAKNIFDKVDDLLEKKLTRTMFEGPAAELNLTENTQPALMACSIALLKSILHYSGKSIKDICCYVAGHSVGEYTALCAAESISLATAAKLLQLRGQLMQKACNNQDGAMAACLNMAREDLELIIRDLQKEGVCNIANDNSDNQVVISGEKNLVERAVAIIKDSGGKGVLLNVNGAFHSSLMQGAQDEMALELSKAEINEPQVPVIMNVSALPTTSKFEIEDNLKQQIVSPVRWREIMLFAQQNELEIIEIGSGQVLSNLAKRANYPFGISTVNDVESLEKFIEAVK